MPFSSQRDPFGVEGSREGCAVALNATAIKVRVPCFKVLLNSSPSLFRTVPTCVTPEALRDSVALTPVQTHLSVSLDDAIWQRSGESFQFFLHAHSLVHFMIQTAVGAHALRCARLPRSRDEIGRAHV